MKKNTGYTALARAIDKGATVDRLDVVNISNERNLTFSDTTA